MRRSLLGDETDEKIAAAFGHLRMPPTAVAACDPDVIIEDEGVLFLRNGEELIQRRITHPAFVALIRTPRPTMYVAADLIVAGDISRAEVFLRKFVRSRCSLRSTLPVGWMHNQYVCLACNREWECDSPGAVDGECPSCGRAGIRPMVSWPLPSTKPGI